MATSLLRPSPQPPQPPSLSYPTLALAYTQGLDEQTLVALVRRGVVCSSTCFLASSVDICNQQQLWTNF